MLKPDQPVRNGSSVPLDESDLAEVSGGGGGGYVCGGASMEVYCPQTTNKHHAREDCQSHNCGYLQTGGGGGDGIIVG